MAAMDVVRQHGWKVAIAAALAGGLGLQWGRIGGMFESAGPKVAHAAERTPSRAIHAEGRLVTYPGAQVVVGTDLGGTLRSLPVLEKTVVKKGDLLAEIDGAEQKAALQEARTRVAEAEVDTRFFDVELGRSERLLASESVAKDTVDRSLHDRDAAKARREAAQASAWRLGTVVNKTRIVSPIDGVVTERFAEHGETVAPGARLVTVADLSRTRVEAEVDEYDAGRIAVGQSVTVTAEGFTGQSWHGKVEEIPDTVTSRRIKPQDPGRPSDTRVLLVKIALGEPVPVKLGQRVEIEITAGLR
jgi:RND family efflux transporter MFP subunit